MPGGKPSIVAHPDVEEDFDHGRYRREADRLFGSERAGCRESEDGVSKEGLLDDLIEQHDCSESSSDL